MRVFRLIVTEWVCGRSWLAVPLFIAFGGLAAQLWAPTMFDPSLRGPARAQGFYAGTQLLSLTYAFIIACDFSGALRARQMRLFWRAQGYASLRLYALVTVAGLVPLLWVTACGGLSIALFGAGAQSLVAKGQAMLLTFLAFACCVPLGVGLAQLLSTGASYIACLGLALLGFFLPGGVEFLLTNAVGPSRILLETLLALVPQLRVGDQAIRLTLGYEPIPWMSFALASGYLVGWFVAFAALGYAFFRSLRP